MTPSLTTSYWPADDSRSVLETTVGDLLRAAATDAPETRALVSIAPGREPRTWTYAELLDDAERAAAWLSARYRPGDHIAVWAPNIPEWLVLQYGAALSGLVLAAINPALRVGELAHALATADAVGVFCVGEHRGTDMRAILREALPHAPRVRATTDLAGWLDEVRATDTGAGLPDVDPHGPTQLQFTSGTTGPAKAAVLSHRAMVTNAAYVRDRCGATPGAVYATALPLFHTAGCGLAGLGTVHHRGTLVLAEVFDPALLLAAIETYGVEAVGGVPTMLQAMLSHPDVEGTDLSSLTTIMSGGDMVPPALVDGWAAVCGASMSAVYGQTELSPIVCQSGPEDSREDVLHTAGRPLPNVEVSIRDPHSGAVQDLGAPGEICARGYQTMLGYYGSPEATARTVDADGWLHTGDLGVMDARGFVTVTGRLKDLIIRGGENISPAEVEGVIASHPAVAQAAVFGVPDRHWGETVAAVITVHGDAARPTAGELHDLVRRALAPHKTPTTWFVAQELPRNAMGKLQKFALRDRWAKGDLTPL
ncbi:class I adenylate-forming enzyme family protein [Tsukamurella ocularis]